MNPVRPPIWIPCVLGSTLIALLPSARVDSSAGATLRCGRVIETDRDAPGEPDFYLVSPPDLPPISDYRAPEREIPELDVCPRIGPDLPPDITRFEEGREASARFELGSALLRAWLREQPTVDASFRVPRRPHSRWVK